MKKVRVLLADSHPQVRTQLAARLQREPDIELIGQTSNSGQTLRAALSNPPDVLLIDPMMRDGFGLANLRQIVARLPTTVIIVLTAYVDTALKIEFDRMGVAHVLTKGLASESLVSVIRDFSGLSNASLGI
jgi:two-component system nitrate/nitrite response regulator NarL